MHADDPYLSSEQTAGQSREEAIGFLVDRINYEQTGVVPYHSRNFKLDRMRKLLDVLGNPQDQLRIIHVAGTKGKGSTCAFLASVLTAAGYRTGVYSSPHLERLEERFAVDGTSCTAEELVWLVNQLRSVLDPLERMPPSDSSEIRCATYFELTTAMALLHFVRRQVDFAILEVGLGGRLDSTNVCRPLVSVITSISLDHTRQLGDTIPEIAREKAGIIKPGIPVVSSVESYEARLVVRQRAAELACPLKLVNEAYFYRFRWQPPRDPDAPQAPATSLLDYWEATPEDGLDSGSGTPATGSRSGVSRLDNLRLGMPGAHQAANAAAAVAIASQLRQSGWLLPEAAVRQGLATARCVARIELLNHSPLVVLDSSHNVASVRALVETLRDGFPGCRRSLVFACSQDKDVAGMLDILLPHFQRVALTRYRKNPRAVEPQQLQQIATRLLASYTGPVPRVQACEDPLQAWHDLRSEATDGDLLCIAGSFFLAAELREIASQPTPAGEVV